MHHLIINSDSLKKKKNAKKFNKITEVFDAAGVEYTVHRTHTKQDVISVTREITSGAGNTVIAVGGDGTLHDVLNGFENLDENFLGLIPFGTGNDFASAAAIPTDVKKAAEIIVAGNVKPIDFIQLSSGLRSINAVGMGIDVDVLKRAYSGKNIKKSKYLHALIVSLAKFKSYNFTVKYGDVEEKHYGLIAALGNGRQFGGGIKMFPDADISDGYMNLVIADYISKFATIGAFMKLMTGNVYKVKQVSAAKVKSVSFIPDQSDYTIQADGELYENMPLEASIVEGKLKFYLK